MTQTKTVTASSWLARAQGSLEEHRETLNSLNFFPVPDGDTGTNLLATLKAAQGTNWAERAQSCLLGAHGNSGTILAAWLAGFTTNLSEDLLVSEDLALAFTQGASRARSALLEPAEGTMLTVMDALGGPHFLAPALEATRSTAQILNENKQAGSADSGALGFLLILEALALELGYPPLDPDTRAQLLRPAQQSPRRVAAGESGELELMFDMRVSPQQLEDMRSVLPSLGNSLSISEISTRGQEIHVAVHLHTAHEKKTLRFLQRLGTVENLRRTSLHDGHTHL